MANFNWGTEEEDWGEAPSGSTPQTKPPRRRWLVLILLLLMGSIGAWGFVRQAEERVSTAVASAEAEIRTSHQLLLQASAEQDTELLQNILSGRDLVWGQSVAGLIRNGRWLPRPQLALTLTTPTLPVSITLNADLNAALVEAPLTYQSTQGETITLIQTSYFRRGELRWLLSPLDLPEWKTTNEFISPHLSATFPVADAELSTRLLGDLATDLHALCKEMVEVTCDPAYPLNVQLGTNPQRLNPLTLQPVAQFSASLRPVILPAPYLLGRPADERAYQFLYRWYARTLFETELREKIFSRYPEAQAERAFHSSMQRLGWLDPIQFRETANTPPLNQMLVLACHTPQGLSARQYGISSESFLSELPVERPLRLNPSPDDSLLIVSQAVADDPAAPPDELLLCPNGDIHDLTQAIGVDGFRFSDWQAWGPERSVQRWQRLIEGSGEPDLFSRNPVIYLFGHAELCRGGAELTQLEAPTVEAIPSPSGNRFLLPDENNFLSISADEPTFANRVALIGATREAVWLTENRIAYFAPEGGLEDSELRIRNLNPVNSMLEEEEITLKYSEFFEAIPTADRPQNLLSPSGLQANGSLRDTLLFLSIGRLAQQTYRPYLFTLNTQTLVPELLFTSDQMYSYSLSPNGRYLIVNALAADGIWTLHQFDLTSGEQRVHPVYPFGEIGSLSSDWSFDGNHYLLLIDGILSLLDLESGQLTLHNPGGFRSCYDATFLSR